MSDQDFAFNPLALEQAAKLPQADTRPPTGQPIGPGAFGVIAGAAPIAAAQFRTTVDEVEEVHQSRLNEAYKPVIDALIEQGVPSSSLLSDHAVYMGGMVGGATDVRGYDYAKVWREAQRRGLKGLPASQAEFEKQATTRDGSRAADLDTLARSQGLPATLAGFAGGLVGSFADYRNWLALPFGGAGKTVAGRILSEGLANAAITAATIPERTVTHARMGEDYTGEQMLTDVGTAAAFGAVVRGGIEAAPHVAAAFRKAVPEHVRLPEEEAALRVIDRQDQVEAANPFERTYQGLDQHAAKLTEAMARIENGSLPVDAPPAALAPSPPPAAVSRARGPEIGSGAGLNTTIVRLLERGGLSAEHARGVAAGIHAESASNPRALNQTSGAFGLGQWLGARKAELFRRYGTNPTLEQQVEFLLWELRGGDAGGAKVLAQGDAGSVLRSYIEDFMRPAKGAETAGDLARGMAALGRAGEDAPGTAGAAANPYADEAALALADEAADVELARVRADVLEAEKPVVTSAGAQVPTATFRPDEIGVDAKLMQFKAGGDAQGVTERLKGVEEWDPIAAGMLTVWEDANGNRLIADGHQRLGLARRLGAESVNAFVLREADGFSARDARIVAALKNIGEGTGTATDAAKIVREAGPEFADRIARRLPPRSALVRDGKALARLSDEAFGAVVNEVIPEAQGAAIGHLAPDPATHLALVGLLARTAPSTRREAEAIIRQALDAGFTRETQNSLFGEAELVRGLYVERAKVLDRGLTALKQLKGAFTVAARNAGALETAGNRIDVAASEAAAAGNAQALGLVERLALRKGNAVNELLDEASRRLAAGETLARVVRDFVAAVRKLDLARLERADGPARGAGDGAERGGRGGEPAGQDEPALQDELTPAERDAAAELGLFGDPPPPSPEQTRAFDSDAGDGVKAAAESDWHDIRAGEDPAIGARRRQQAELAAKSPLRANAEQSDTGGLGLFDHANEPTFDLDDGKGPRTAAEIDAEIQAAKAGLEEIRKCLK